MTRFKICGISQAQHVVAAADAGADFIGLIFALSKRRVTPEKAKEVIEEARSLQPSLRRHLEVVGVFVNFSAKELNEIADYCGLDRVQLHGDETLEDCSDIQRPIIKVARLPAHSISEGELAKLEEELEGIESQGYLPMLDTVSTGPYYGGTGQPLDWKAIARLASKHNFMLSGGLNPANVSRAIKEVRPWGVDTSSGVEIEGIKDMGKIKAFAEAVTEVDSKFQHSLRQAK